MSQGNPEITVLLPVYNAARYLLKAVRSVLDQTFTDIEVLVIDDGSTDGTGRILSRIDDPRLRTITLTSNGGLIAALNLGLDHARGEFMARMDGDDVMLPERLARLRAMFALDPGLTAAATALDHINADGEVIGQWKMDSRTPDEESVRNMLPRSNCIASVMVRMAAVQALRYNPAQVGMEDWDLLLRMRSRGMRIAKLNEPLYQYRLHPGSVMAIAKKRRPSELRVLAARHRFLVSEWEQFRFNSTHVLVLNAQARTVARHLMINVFPPLLRDIYRLLTYSPLALLREKQALRNALLRWNGEHLFCFPYVCVGGAEQIHADILSAIADRSPVVLICGYSRDRAFEDRFKKSATLVDVPRLVNHPLTRKAALHAIADRMDRAAHPTLFSSLTNTLFDLLPLVGDHVRTFHLQHAFLYQPAANLQQKRWLPQLPRIDHFIFYSRQAKGDFERFLVANNVPYDPATTFRFLPNAVHRFGEVATHQRTGILFVGRRSPVKRMELFLRLADELEGKAPGLFRFNVVGYDAIGDRPYVTFHGTVSDTSRLSAIYSAQDMVVQTSTLEGFPMVIMEAMAHALIILSTPVGDVPNQVDNTFGLVTSSTDAGTMLSEMAGFVRQVDADRERMERMKRVAFQRAKEQFDPATFRERYRALLISPASEA